jgi:hypothetical protein
VSAPRKISRRGGDTIKLAFRKLNSNLSEKRPFLVVRRYNGFIFQSGADTIAWLMEFHVAAA